MSSSLDRHALENQYKVFAILVAYARLLNFTHEDLIRILGVSHKTLVAYEKKRDYIPDEFLRRFADHISLCLSYDEDDFYYILRKEAQEIDPLNGIIEMQCHYAIVRIFNNLMIPKKKRR